MLYEVITPIPLNRGEASVRAGVVDPGEEGSCRACHGRNGEHGEQNGYRRDKDEDAMGDSRCGGSHGPEDSYRSYNFV